MDGLSLEMFKPRVVEVEILDAGGNVVLVVPLATLNWSDYQAEIMKLPEVAAPLKRGVKNGQVGEVPDFQNKDYQKAVRERNERLMSRLVILCLMRAGNLAELKDADEAAQLEALAQFDTGILKALTASVEDMLMGARKRLKSAAATFPADNSADS